MLDIEKIKDYYTDDNLEHVGESDTLIQAILYDIPDLIAEVERLRRELVTFSWLADRCTKKFLENLSAELNDPNGSFLRGEGMEPPVGILP